MRGAKFLVIGLVAGCWTSSTTPAPTAPPPPPPAEEPVPEEPGINVVSSMVIVDACPDSKKLDTKLATREIDELVGPCKKVPSGTAHFSATLLPGGRVELASPTGDPAQGIVPTCLLQKQSQLKHKLRLTSACKFDVKLEERTGSGE